MNLLESSKKKLEERKPNSVYYYLLIVYIVSSIINWLPILDNNVVRILKYIIFLIIFLYEVSSFGIRYPSNFLSPKGMLLIFFAMLPGMFLSFGYESLVDIFIPFILMFIFNYKKQFYYKVLYESAKIVAIISVLSIFSNYTGLFDIKPNGPWSATFGKSGFGGYRTGYSNSLFLYVPILVFWHRVKQKSIISADFILILLIISAQYISGGRAGVIASLLVLLFWLRVSVSYKVILLGFVLFSSQLEVVQAQFRVQDIETNDNALDKISSGRVVLNTYYLGKVIEAPFFGYGFGNKDNMFMGTEAHIVWLRNAFNGGLIYLGLLVFIFISIFNNIKNNFALTSEEQKLFYSVFFTTLIITFLEPNYLIGSVQGEIVYWVIISLLLKKHNPILPISAIENKN